MDEENQIQRFEPARITLKPERTALARPYEVLEMEESPDLLAYWRIIRKRRWTILSIFFVVVTVILIGTLRMTPIYRAEVLLEIQKENPSILSVQELFELDSVSDAYLETQYKVLQSESLARRVINELNLLRLEEFNPKKGWWSSGSAEDKTPASTQVFSVGESGIEQDAQSTQDAVQRFENRLGVAPVKRSRLVEVTFESKDPELAARVVNTLAHNYIEQNLEARWEATQKASEWLTQQLTGLKGRLETSEEELQKYAQTQGLLFLETDEGKAENIVNERLRRLQEELTRAQAERYQKESLYRLIRAGDYGSLPGVFESKLMQDLTVRLAELRRDYAQLSTTFTPEYPKVKQIQSQIDELEAVLQRERQRAAHTIVNEYQAAVDRESLVRQAFEAQQVQANEIATKSVQYNILKREVDTNKQLYEGLLQRLKEAGVSAGLKASNVRIVDPATPPQKPAKPKLFLNMALALVLGMGLGVGAAFLQEYLDNTLKTAEDVERFLRVPALAMIPSVESLNGRRGAIYGVYGARARKFLGRGNSVETTALAKRPANWFRLDQQDQPSVLAEAFRGLRTSVLLSTADHPPRSLLVSSAQPGEGKTTVSINLAISLAQLGERVLLIDADLRRPCIHRSFSTPDSTGVVGYLTGQADWQQAVRPSNSPGLDLLVCGPIPPNPAELLSSTRMQTLLTEAMGVYGFVVVDSPPLLSVADSRVLSTLVDGIVLIVKGGSTPRELAQRAQAHAQSVGGNVIGVVLNNLDVRADDYYYSRYYRSDYYIHGGEQGKPQRG